MVLSCLEKPGGKGTTSSSKQGCHGWVSRLCTARAYFIRGMPSTHLNIYNNIGQLRKSRASGQSPKQEWRFPSWINPHWHNKPCTHSEEHVHTYHCWQLCLLPLTFRVSPEATPRLPSFGGPVPIYLRGRLVRRPLTSPTPTWTLPLHCRVGSGLVNDAVSSRRA